MAAARFSPSSACAALPPPPRRFPLLQVTNLGWSLASVTATTNICMQVVAPCDTPDALCAGSSCRYAIFNEEVGRADCL